MSDLMLDVDQAGELKAAFRRGDWTNEEIKKASEGDFLSQVRGVIRGTHQIVPIDHVVDLSVPCELPFGGAERLSSAKTGIIKLELIDENLCANGKKINLFWSEKQKAGGHGGHDLRKELEARGGNHSAKILDYLKVHPELWPEDWKKDENGNTIFVFFWDDIFRNPSSGRLSIRCGYWSDGKVVSDYFWLDHDWNAHYPAASDK